MWQKLLVLHAEIQIIIFHGCRAYDKGARAAYLASEPFFHVLGHLDQSLRLLELMLTDVHQLWGRRRHIHPLRHDVTTPIFHKG